MEIRALDNGNYVSLEPIGCIDANTAPAFEKELIPVIERERNCLVNMEAVPYISSAGLRVIMVAAKISKKVNSKLFLYSNQETVKEVLEISGFNKLLNIYESINEALEALSI